MALRIAEFFGRVPGSPAGLTDARANRCPFVNGQCIKPRHGSCSLVGPSEPLDPIIACPNRLYADNYRILKDIADRVFAQDSRLLKASNLSELTGLETLAGNEVAVFGRYWGQELPLSRPRNPKGMKEAGNYFIDWILAKVDRDGALLEFTAVEVQTIDTTGSYIEQSVAFFDGITFTSGSKKNPGYSKSGMNWENVNKRILPQLIYKGHVLRREPKCTKGLFFVCPKQVLERIKTRLGHRMQSYPISNSTITFRSYEVGPAEVGVDIRPLRFVEEFTTVVDEVARALTFPDNLPDMGAYERAISAVLKS